MGQKSQMNVAHEFAVEHVLDNRGVVASEQNVGRGIHSCQGQYPGNVWLFSTWHGSHLQRGPE
jgi:hypothetical protein